MGQPAESLSPTVDSTFPPTLAEVPAEERAEECFGWMPANFAIGFFVLAGGVAAEKNARLIFPAAIAAFGALLAFYEIKRRRSPTAIARRQGKLAVYRDGKLSGSYAVGQATRMYLRITNSLQNLMLPVGLVVLGGALAVSPGKNDDARWIGVVLFFLGLAVTSSVVRTRFLLHHYYVPKEKGRRTELVLLRKEDSARLFGRNDGTHL